MARPNRVRAQVENPKSGADLYWSRVRDFLPFRNDREVQDAWKLKFHFGLVPPGNPMWLALNQAEVFAARGGHVIIQGPPGSPKLEMANLIHATTPRSAGAPRVLSCAGAEPRDLTKAAALARTSNATLILTHLDKAPPPIQGKILGLVDGQAQERSLRCVCTAGRDLSELTASEGFDADLLACLNFDRRIIIPPLRDHNWDIMPTVISCVCQRDAMKQIRHLTYAAVLFLMQFEWNGDFRQLIQCVNDLVTEALISGDTAIRLEHIIKQFRHVVPPPKKVVYGTEDSDRLVRWKTRLGSEEMAQFIVRHTSIPAPDDAHESDGWVKFEREKGYCPLLFASDVGDDNLVCKLRLLPSLSSRSWLASEKNPHRSGWVKLLHEAEHGRECQVTLASADTEILFDTRKMERELAPFLSTLSATTTLSPQIVATSRKYPDVDAKSPKRRHARRDWQIHDEVEHVRRRLGWGNMDRACETVALKWESISARRVRNLFYELEPKKRPLNCRKRIAGDLVKRYPELTRPEMG